MTAAFRPRTFVLFLGDIFFFGFSLWLSLALRSFSLPPQDVFEAHLAPFLSLFAVWVIVFFIAGLYESRALLFQARVLSASLLWAQFINIIIAALFFFFLPIFGIAPKTLLIIYLIVSFLLILFWRTVLFPWLGLQKPEEAVLIGDSQEAKELLLALSQAPQAPLRIVKRISLDELPVALGPTPRLIIADTSDRRVAAAFPDLYNLLQQGVRFIDVDYLYEEMFGRIPLSTLTGRWVARNVSVGRHAIYDAVKRLMDIAVALLAGLFSLILYPFVILAITLDDGGPTFIAQTRVGQGDRSIRIYKFRSMQRNETALSQDAADNAITRVGKLLRATRLDELPQLWNVLRGDLSLIGPRPELPAGVALYEKEIPFYGVRHLIKPGLSGWAQLYHDNHPHHAAQVEATREKLSYDLYYLKHRSLLLDSIIALKTLKKLLTRSGV